MKPFHFAGAILLLLLCGCVSYEEAKQMANAGDPAMQFKVAEMLKA